MRVTLVDERAGVIELAAAVRRGEVSATEVTRALLERIDALNPALRAFVAVDAARARRQAA
ncbi:MAG TPA: hypothetical protein VNN07_09445, partial [Candidatus Tectomicrobia bacterium]|nr:hypothetical protein [Candidatus Tectomicrobia bacterium]